MNPPLASDADTHTRTSEAPPSQSDATPTSAVPPVPPLSEEEATHYYDGLPSRPRLLARTSTRPWAERKRKWLSPASHPALSDVWGRTVGPKVVAHLDERGVNWTSLDIVRINEAAADDDDVDDAWEETRGPVVLWIGVTPRSLARDDAHAAAFGCLGILRGYGITDIEVELRESQVVFL